MSSYIINNNTLIAKTSEHHTSGKTITYSNQKSKETLNASREFNLVNASQGKISNAKKWEQEFNKSEIGFAEEVNDGEFYIS